MPDARQHTRQLGGFLVAKVRGQASKIAIRGRLERGKRDFTARAEREDATVQGPRAGTRFYQAGGREFRRILVI